jgi:hypothetical protein
VSNKAAASQPSQPGALTFTHTVLFHLRLSATTDDASSLTVKYRNFEGAELRANLAAGEEIQVPGTVLLDKGGIPWCRFAR